MTIKYGTIVTNVGLTKLNNAALLGETLTIAKVKFGDSNGAEYTPGSSATDLKNVVYESEVIASKESDDNNHWVTIESLIPYNQGGFWVRELGIYDADGDLIFIEAVAPRYKPDSSGESAVDMSFSTTVDIIQNGSVEFKVNPHLAIATVKYVDEISDYKVNKSDVTDNYNLNSSVKVASAKALMDGLATKCNKSDVTDSYNLNSSLKVASAKALMDGLATKCNKSDVTDNYNLDSAVKVASARALRNGLATKWNYTTANVNRWGATMLSNNHQGTSESLATTEKALKDGLEWLQYKQELLINGKSDVGHLHDDRYLRKYADNNFSGDLISTSRNRGLFGSFDRFKTDQIWSMGTAYRNDSNGSNFGNLYGLGYKHTNNSTGGEMAGGHQAAWCDNGSPRAAMGYDGLWGLEVYDGPGTERKRVYSPNNKPDASELTHVIPVGVPFPWAGATIPPGFLEMRGQSFDKARYPLLAQVFTDGILDDLRDEFIRGKGAGRSVRSRQGCEIQSHSHSLTVGFNSGGSPNYVAKTEREAYPQYNHYRTNNEGGSETRPRNIAYYYIVKAA